jgi:hypothetical protein
METINSVATAAAKAVWGEGDASKEPVSGAQGNVAKGEPYDAGNLDTPAQEKVEARLGNFGNDDGTSPSDKATGATTGVTTSTAADTSTKQIDTRHPEEVTEEPEVVDPDNLKGPGPKPIDVVAKEHGGDAGQSKQEPVGLSSGVAAENPAPSDDKKATSGDQAGSGTGEEYIKTTGFSADGGDFDATKPGAGKEADRLLEKKDHEGGATPAAAATTDKVADKSTETNGSDSKDTSKSKHSKNKPSLTERIKAKFHRH